MTQGFQSVELRDCGDDALAAAIAAGDESAFAEAYRRHGGRVFGVASRFCGPEHAEEVTQDIFMELWSSPERFQSERGSLAAYLLAQSHGRAVDRLRSDTSRRNRETATVWDGWAALSVESDALAHLTGDRVWTLLAGLAEGPRCAIALAYFGGYTYREVAAGTGVPEGTVKSRIRAGLAQLRSQLGDDPEVVSLPIMLRQ